MMIRPHQAGHVDASDYDAWSDKLLGYSPDRHAVILYSIDELILAESEAAVRQQSLSRVKGIQMVQKPEYFK